MNPETQEKIKLLKGKGLTIQEIKGILNLTNHDLYDEPKKKARPEPPENSNGNKTGINTGIIVATNPTINKFAEQQEECLRKLREVVNTPFENEWAYLKWKREVIMLSLSQIEKRTLHLDSRAFYYFLIANPEETDQTRAKQRRNTVATIIHNDLVITFANARMELANRETHEEEFEKL